MFLRSISDNNNLFGIILKELVIENSISTQSLNDQAFPGGYVIKDGQGVQTITGSKAFRNSIGNNIQKLIRFDIQN